MEEAHRELLTKHMNQFMSDLDLIEVIPSLQEAGILRDHHVENLTQKSDETRQDRVRRLILLLKRSKPSAFQAFYDSLIKSGQDHLAEILESAIPVGLRKLNQPCMMNGHKLERISSPTGGLPVVRSWDDINLLFPAAPDQNVSQMAAVDTNKHPTETARDNSEPPVFDPIEHYANFSQPKGLALILHNINFARMERSGSEKDRDALISMFSDFGYEIIVKEDLTAGEMQSELDKFAKDARHFSSDSCVVAVMTHGLHGKLYGVDHETVDVINFVSSLNTNRCPALRDKPKLFFIQSCRVAVNNCTEQVVDVVTIRVENPDGDVDVTDNANLSNVLAQDVADTVSLRKRIPADADTFVGYSTTPRNVAYRDSQSGTWYLQTLVEVFRQYATHDDLLSMMTKVNGLVAKRVTGGGNQQVPDHCSRLRKKFYFYIGLCGPVVEEGVPGRYIPNPADKPKKEECKVKGKCCTLM